MARKPTTDKLRLFAIQRCTQVIDTSFNHINRSGKVATDIKQQTQKTLKKALKQAYRDAKNRIRTRTDKE